MFHAEGTARAKVLRQDPVRSVEEQRGGLCARSRVNQGREGGGEAGRG